MRPLVPGPEEALRREVELLGAGPLALAEVAARGSVAALAVSGLSASEVAVVERELGRRGGTVLAAPDGRAVLLGPLAAVGALPAALSAWGRATEDLGEALGGALASRGAPPPPLRFAGHQLDIGRRTLVMGIVNVTPDSFSGDGVGADPAAASEQAAAMVEAGADLIDVGGESSRPHAQPVPVATELERVVPAIDAVRAAVAVPVSVDTRHAAVAEAAIRAGATIVNDIWGLRADPEMAAVAARHAVAVAVMHNQRGSAYDNLMEAVCRGLAESLAVAVEAGIASERVIVDPGVGFGKTPADNLEVTRRLGELRALGRPILYGASRKSTIGALLGGLPPGERVEGSVALAVLAASAGADIVRVHDVRETVRALRVADAVVRGTPAELAARPAPGPTG